MSETSLWDVPLSLQPCGSGKGTVIVGSPHHLSSEQILHISKGIVQMYPGDCVNRFECVPTMQESRRQIHASLVIVASQTGGPDPRLAFFGQILPFHEVPNAVEVTAIRDSTVATSTNSPLIVNGLQKIYMLAMRASLIRALINDYNLPLIRVLETLHFSPSGHPQEWWLPISNYAPSNRSHLDLLEMVA